MKKPIPIILIITVFFLNTSLQLKSVYAKEDSNENRQTYSYQQANEGAIKNITFNSIKVVDTDAAWAEANDLELPLLGNETNFVGAREDTGINAGSNNVWEGTEITAEDGKIYLVRLYVHNNSSGGMDSVAEDTKVRFYVPYGSADSQTVDGWLTSSNATPTEYSDTVVFNSIDGIPFHLEYVSGSALLENGGFASGAGVQLPDTITNQGNPTNEAEDEWTLIGYDALDGRVPGCYEYINYVSIKVQVIYDYEFSVETKVRLADDEDKTWHDSIEAKVGDKVEFQIHYQNTGTAWQEHISVRDVLPSNLRYIAGSTKLMNASHQDGDKVNEDYLVDKGLKIGSYSPDANAYILFVAEIIDEDLSHGSNALYNWGQVGVGSTVVQDYATVIVYNDEIFKIIILVLIILIFICLVSIGILLVKKHRLEQSSARLMGRKGKE